VFGQAQCVEFLKRSPTKFSLLFLDIHTSFYEFWKFEREAGRQAGWALTWRLGPAEEAARGPRMGRVSTGPVVAGRRQGAAVKHQWDSWVALGRLRRDGTHLLDAATVRRSGGSMRRRVSLSSSEWGSTATLVSSRSYGEGRER
jgi:hypothetical protein